MTGQQYHKIIAYVRVSALGQSEERQKVIISQKYHVDRWFIEKVSGKNMQREQLNQLFDYAREGDLIVYF